MSAPFLLGVMGPTASGKSNLAEEIASRTGAQLMNVDAFQIYRGMDIGTGKSSEPDQYELLDIKNPDEAYGVGEFVSDALAVLNDRFEKGQSVVAVGGTGFYMRALFEEYSEMSPAPPPELRDEIRQMPFDVQIDELLKADPNAANRLDMRNPVRVSRALEKIKTGSISIKFELPKYKKYKVAIVPNIEKLNLNIYQRVQIMVQNGWVGETKKLLDQGYSTDDPGFRAIGYRTMSKVVSGELDLDSAISAIALETTQYAKRQRSWLRKEPNVSFVESVEEARQFALTLEIA